MILVMLGIFITIIEKLPYERGDIKNDNRNFKYLSGEIRNMSPVQKVYIL